MKAWIACLVIIASASLASLAAQAPMAKMAITSDEDFSKAMKDINTQNAALRKSLATPAEADATASAQKLEALFKDVQAYWEMKKVEDATTSSKSAVAAAQAVVKAVAAHDMAAATAASTTLGGTCMTCHTAHRDRQADGTSKIK